MIIRGITTDGKKVIAGLFSIYETEGIPLDIILNSVKDNDMIPCWISLYQEAKAAGMGHSHIVNKLEPAICDSYGSEFAQIVIDKLSLYYRHLQDLGQGRP